MGSLVAFRGAPLGAPWAPGIVRGALWLFGGVSRAPRNFPGGALTKKTPPKRAPARDPDMSPRRTLYVYICIVWTLTWVISGSRAGAPFGGGFLVNAPPGKSRAPRGTPPKSCKAPRTMPGEPE